MELLHNLGANEVIPEEYETSVEIFSRVLEKYQVPRKRIESFIEHIRSDGYEMFRSISKEPYCDSNLSMISNEIFTLKVDKESLAAGQSIASIGLKSSTINLLAIHRDSKAINNPDENFVLQPEDIVVFLAPESKIQYIEDLFRISKDN